MALFTSYINSEYTFFLILDKMRAQNGKKMQEISKTTHIWSVVKWEQETTERWFLQWKSGCQFLEQDVFVNM